MTPETLALCTVGAWTLWLLVSVLVNNYRSVKASRFRYVEDDYMDRPLHYFRYNGYAWTTAPEEQHTALRDLRKVVERCNLAAYHPRVVAARLDNTSRCCCWPKQKPTGAQRTLRQAILDIHNELGERPVVGTKVIDWIWSADHHLRHAFMAAVIVHEQMRLSEMYAILRAMPVPLMNLIAEYCELI
jgi:hypothetical protein